MILKFHLDIEDWMSFQRKVIQDSKQIQLTRKILMYGVPLLMLIIGLLLNFNRTGQQMLISFGLILFFSGVWMFFQFRTFYKRLEKRYRKIITENKNENLIGDQEIIFENDKFVFKAQNFGTTVGYDKILKTFNNNEYVYLYLNELSAVILPLNKIDLSKDELKKLEIFFSKMGKKD